MNVLSFWGKSQRDDADTDLQWHPLAYHCLDVAAVGDCLLNQHSSLTACMSRLLGADSIATINLVRFLLSIHDIGKFAKKFQAKVPKLFPDCFDDNPAELPTSYNHVSGGFRLFSECPSSFNLPGQTRDRAWLPIVSAIVGHHGSPPDLSSTTPLQTDYGSKGIEAADHFARQTHRLLAVSEDFPILKSAAAKRASHALSGIAVLADWIGSNEKWFPYCSPELPLEDYWKQAQKQAEYAIEQAGILPACASEALELAALIGADAKPSPMQNWAKSVTLPTEPALYMIEDETGSGKTEAALMLAHRLMSADRKENRADGLYISLPTTATANAMFARCSRVYRKLFAADSEPSAALVHGRKDMQSKFREVALQGGTVESSFDNKDTSEATSSASCADWIADDRRRAFLADIGAGTVDQALLSILPCRHQSLRLLGLMRRVLIVDEVHAYDAYMQKEIECLLEFQAGLGGSAILLSATLPQSIRNKLSKAFAKGLGSGTATDSVPSMEYPLATIRSANMHIPQPVLGQPERARTLPLRFLRNAQQALHEVEQAARAGKAVLYIRNTVDDALDAYERLAEKGLAADLFHARFAFVDRLEIEQRIVRSFGKDSKHEDRTGKVLIATQVVEQSLDLDFDAMVTDLAPIDLIIQRAGRLWRHHRPQRQGRPELLIVSPPPAPATGIDENWYKALFPQGAYVYKNHALLWHSSKILEERGCIESPGGLRMLIEEAYQDNASELPDALRDNLLEAEGAAGAERSIATTNILKFSQGYLRDAGSWDTDQQTPTRLADLPQVTLRLAVVKDGSIIPYAAGSAPGDPMRAWRLSEVNIAERRVGGSEIEPAEYKSAIQQVKESWQRYDADKHLLLLENDGANQTNYRAVASAVRLSYDSQKGLIWKPPS